MAIRTIILDDELAEAQRLKGFLEQYGALHQVNFQIQVYTSAAVLLEEYDNSCQLMFLDIELEDEKDLTAGLNGVEAARKIRDNDARVGIVFVTNMAQMAIRGYEVQALDFIVKPVSYYALELKLNGILQRIETVRPVKLVLTVGKHLYKFSSDELCYVEVDGHNLYYHTTRETYQQRAALHDLEDKLEGQPFFRCNNCYLVNLNYVEGVEDDIVLVAGDRLLMSRPRKKAFLQKLAEYIGGMT